MKKLQKNDAYERINITMPTSTLKKLDKLAKKGDRSSLITDALNEYLMEVGRESIRAKLKEGAIAMAQEELEIAREWDLIDAEWPE